MRECRQKGGWIGECGVREGGSGVDKGVGASPPACNPATAVLH